MPGIDFSARGRAGWMPLLFWGVGIVTGIMLVAMLPGMPWSALVEPRGATEADALDLAAQRSMAAAAWWMVAITGGSTLIGGFALFLLARTLIETRKGAEAAFLSARTAEFAVRAFLLVEFAHVAIDREALRISFKVRNSGASPAHNVAFRTRLIVSSNDGHSRHERSLTKSRSDIAANAERNASADFDKVLAADVSDNYGQLVLEAEITLLYTDVFGREHEEVSLYGRNVSYFELDEKKSLYRDVGKGVRWGD